MLDSGARARFFHPPLNQGIASLYSWLSSPSSPAAGMLSTPLPATRSTRGTLPESVPEACLRPSLPLVLGSEAIARIPAISIKTVCVRSAWGIRCHPCNPDGSGQCSCRSAGPSHLSRDRRGIPDDPSGLLRGAGRIPRMLGRRFLRRFGGRLLLCVFFGWLLRGGRGGRFCCLDRLRTFCSAS